MHISGDECGLFYDDKPKLLYADNKPIYIRDMRNNNEVNNKMLSCQIFEL